MSETKENATNSITSEAARELLMTAVEDVIQTLGGENEREELYQTLRNNDSNVRDVLAACVHEKDVIEAFTWAASKNDVALLQAFCDIGMNVNVKDQEGDCVLIIASAQGHEESVRWLLDRNTNVDIEDNGGWTPLINASANGHVVAAELLLKRNANPDHQNDYGSTALMTASQNDFGDIVQLLLRYDANIDLKDTYENNALSLATKKEIKEMLQNHVSTSYVLK